MLFLKKYTILDKHLFYDANDNFIRRYQLIFAKAFIYLPPLNDIYYGGGVSRNGLVSLWNYVMGASMEWIAAPWRSEFCIKGEFCIEIIALPFI